MGKADSVDTIAMHVAAFCAAVLLFLSWYLTPACNQLPEPATALENIDKAIRCHEIAMEAFDAVREVDRLGTPLEAVAVMVSYSNKWDLSDCHELERLVR